MHCTLSRSRLLDAATEKENTPAGPPKKKPKTVSSVAKALSRTTQERANGEVTTEEVEQGDLNVSPTVCAPKRSCAITSRAACATSCPPACDYAPALRMRLIARQRATMRQLTD